MSGRAYLKALIIYTGTHRTHAVMASQSRIQSVFPVLTTQGWVGLRAVVFLLCLGTTGLVVPCLGDAVLIDELPRDEWAAQRALADGVLDSATWEELQPFYADPLIVPLGHLAYLRHIFPNLPDSLPVTDQVLERYEPWSAHDIDRFFEEHHYLVPLKPILGFTAGRSTFARAGFSSAVSMPSERTRQSVRMALAPGEVLRAEATVDCRVQSARWRRRYAQVDIPVVGTLRVGNFDFVMNRGLFYGWFPSSTDSREHTARNWLYGGTRTWNGVANTVSFADGTVLTDLFYHTRASESAAGVKVTGEVGRLAGFYAGLSCLDTARTGLVKDVIRAAHTGFFVSSEVFSLTVESGVDPGGCTGVPVVVRIGVGDREHSIAATITRLPGGFAAPRSSVLHSYCGRLACAPKLRNAVTGVDVEATELIGRQVRKTFGASYAATGSVSDLVASWALRGREPFVWYARYVVKVSSVLAHPLHRCRLRMGSAMGRPVVITAGASVVGERGERHGFGLDAQVDFGMTSALVISPGAQVTVADGEVSDITVRLEQRIGLFERTYSEFGVRVPVRSADSKEIVAHAKGSFLF